MSRAGGGISEKRHKLSKMRQHGRALIDSLDAIEPAHAAENSDGPAE
jgi:hypothetical protein